MIKTAQPLHMMKATDLKARPVSPGPPIEFSLL